MNVNRHNSGKFISVDNPAQNISQIFCIRNWSAVKGLTAPVSPVLAKGSFGRRETEADSHFTESRELPCKP